MKFSDIHIRDPFILPLDGTYYLYGSRQTDAPTFNLPGTGLDVYTSADLETWSDPHECFTPPVGFWADRDFWAPEVHHRGGAFYMFVSFKTAGACRGTQILRADSPLGPFLPISEGPVTPRDWECLDGTFYEDETGAPWIVFCHEWVQIGNGTVCAMPLSDDLTRAVGQPVELFRAHDPAWVTPPFENSDGYVTDGPFLVRASDGGLRMIWASFSAPDCYAEALAFSESGSILGPWRHAAQPLFEKDGGHGMIFTAFDGQQYLILHRPNSRPNERPFLIPIRETADGYEVLTEGARG